MGVERGLFFLLASELLNIFKSAKNSSEQLLSRSRYIPTKMHHYLTHIFFVLVRVLARKLLLGERELHYKALQFVDRPMIKLYSRFYALSHFLRHFFPVAGSLCVWVKEGKCILGKGALH